MRIAAARALALAATAASVSVAVEAAGPRATPVAQRVTGTVERVIHAQGPCRGGAAITREEMAEWHAKEQRFPLARETFTLFAGDKHAGKPVTRFKTDRVGRFDVSLPPGRFCVMAGEHQAVAPAKQPQAAQPTSAHVDADCLRDLALACDAVLYVRKDATRDVKLTLDTFTRCPQPWAQPCYRGPAPP
jgi:hypothetical protein